MDEGYNGIRFKLRGWVEFWWALLSGNELGNYILLKFKWRLSNKGRIWEEEFEFELGWEADLCERS